MYTVRGMYECGMRTFEAAIESSAPRVLFACQLKVELVGHLEEADHASIGLI